MRALRTSQQLEKFNESDGRNTLDDEQLVLFRILGRAVLELSKAIHSEQTGVLLADLLAGLRRSGSRLGGSDDALTDDLRLFGVLLEPLGETGVDRFLDGSLDVSIA